METVERNGDFDIHTFLTTLTYDQWISLQPSGWHPPARYKHAAAVIHDKLYVVGGSRNGRYLSDVQVFDLRHLRWSTMNPNRDTESPGREKTGECIPACAGHSLVHWNRKLLIVAGNSKKSSDTVTVWSLDLGTHACNVVNTSGRLPCVRAGQSVTLVGSRLIMFGGEDSKRWPLNDLHVLDLETMVWDAVETKGNSPSPRFDHSTAVHAGNYLLIFGGSSQSTCYGDVHVLDLQTMEWSQPDIQGADIAPRGGHASTTVSENMYVVGGGDNQRGASDTLVLNMSKLAFSVATTVNEHHPLASEGLTLCSTKIEGENVLIAFGGYNGSYNNEVYLLRPTPKKSTRPRLFQSPAAAAAAASVSAAYALTNVADSKGQNDAVDGRTNRDLDENSIKAVCLDTDANKADKNKLESRLLEVRSENLKLKNNLEEINNSHTELSMELRSVQSQLVAERSRCIKLELQIAEMQKSLESLNSIEQELELLRQQKQK